MDLVIIRENEEDLYAGIEYQQTDEMTQSLKLISAPGCERSSATRLNTPGPTNAKR
jgi:isocitrate dehydrogenase